MKHDTTPNKIQLTNLPNEMHGLPNKIPRTHTLYKTEPKQLSKHSEQLHRTQ
jgi:hypothetical protein